MVSVFYGIQKISALGGARTKDDTQIPYAYTVNRMNSQTSSVLVILAKRIKKLVTF